MRIVKTCTGYAVTNGESLFSKKYKRLFDSENIAECEAFIKSHAKKADVTKLQEIVITCFESYTKKNLLLKSLENKIMKLYDECECVEITNGGILSSEVTIKIYPRKYKDCYFIFNNKKTIPKHMNLREMFLNTINPNRRLSRPEYEYNNTTPAKLILKFYNKIDKKESDMKWQDVVRKNQRRAVKAKKRKKQLAKKGLSGTIVRIKSLLFKPGRRRSTTPAKTNTRYVGRIAKGKYLYRVKKA